MNFKKNYLNFLLYKNFSLHRIFYILFVGITSKIEIINDEFANKMWKEKNLSY